MALIELTGAASVPYYIRATGNPTGDTASALLIVSISTQTSATTTAITTTSIQTTSSSTYSTTAVSGMHVALQLSTTDANGKSTSSFTGGGTMLAQAIIINDGSVPLTNVYLLVSIYDSNNVPIFTGISVVSLNAGQEAKVSLGPTLSAAAAIGTYLVQAIVLTSVLNAGSVPVSGGVGAVTFTVN